MPIPYQFCNDLLIHHQSKSIISISDQSIDPSSNQLSDANPRQICSPIHHHNANPPRHYQSINPMPILRKIANPGPIHQSNASPGPIPHQTTESLQSTLDLSTSPRTIGRHWTVCQNWQNFYDRQIGQTTGKSSQIVNIVEGLKTVQFVQLVKQSTNLSNISNSVKSRKIIKIAENKYLTNPSIICQLKANRRSDTEDNPVVERGTSLLWRPTEVSRRRTIQTIRFRLDATPAPILFCHSANIH